MSLIRYPGSKAKLADAIIEKFPEEYALPLHATRDGHYIEPFFGSGAVGFSVMRNMDFRSRVTIADLDIGMASLWRAVWKEPQALQKMIWQFTPSVEAFYEFKARDGEFTDTVDTGFRKLALHRLSVSGFGAMAGGPIGGRHQSGDYNVDCRWRPTRMVKECNRLNRLMNRFASFTVEHASVFDVLPLAESSRAPFVYMDPPYYVQGDALYAVKFTKEQHTRLAKELSEAEYPWALSYDDHPEIRNLYQEFEVHELEVRYSNAVTKDTRRKNHEILITSRRLPLQPVLYEGITAESCESPAS